jgi:type IV secretory pathway VirB3-like protein
MVIAVGLFFMFPPSPPSPSQGSIPYQRVHRYAQKLFGVNYRQIGEQYTSKTYVYSCCFAIVYVVVVIICVLTNTTKMKQIFFIFFKKTSTCINRNYFTKEKDDHTTIVGANSYSTKVNYFDSF